MQALLVALDLQKYWPPRPVIHSAVFIWVRHGIGVERPADRGLRRQLLPPLQTQGLKNQRGSYRWCAPWIAIRLRHPASTLTAAKDKTARQAVTYTPPMTRNDHVLEDTERGADVTGW